MKGKPFTSSKSCKWVLLVFKNDKNNMNNVELLE
jgi:hypothetical protein